MVLAGVVPVGDRLVVVRDRGHPARAVVAGGGVVEPGRVPVVVGGDLPEVVVPGRRRGRGLVRGGPRRGGRWQPGRGRVPGRDGGDGRVAAEPTGHRHRRRGGSGGVAGEVVRGGRGPGRAGPGGVVRGFGDRDRAQQVVIGLLVGGDQRREPRHTGLRHREGLAGQPDPRRFEPAGAVRGVRPGGVVDGFRRAGVDTGGVGGLPGLDHRAGHWVVAGDRLQVQPGRIDRGLHGGAEQPPGRIGAGQCVVGLGGPHVGVRAGRWWRVRGHTGSRSHRHRQVLARPGGVPPVP